MQGRKYIIASDYLNALSILKSLQELNISNNDIFLLNTSGRNMAGKIFPELNIIHNVKRNEGLIDYLISFDRRLTKYVFLTDESFHKILWKEKKMLKDWNVIVHFGNNDPDLILNKSKLLEIASKEAGMPTPKEYSLDDPKIQFPVFVKFRESFYTATKAPPGNVITNQVELELYFKRIEKLGYNKRQLLLQELLSTRPEDLISIVGWYDKDFHSLFQTKKILMHPPKRGGGDVVELMELNKDLIPPSLSLLKTLDYHGPFEMELIRERAGRVYKLIELNPRFWMQHGLIEQISGNLLVARYIGVPATIPGESYRYWMYTSIVLIQLAKIKLRYFQFLFKKDVYKPISFSQGGKFLAKYLKQKLLNEKY